MTRKFQRPEVRFPVKFNHLPINSRRTNSSLLVRTIAATFVMLLIGCDTYPYLGPTGPMGNVPASGGRATAYNRATCLHPTCSKPAPYNSRSLMVCDYHSRYQPTPDEQSLLTAVKSGDHARLRQLLGTVNPNFLGRDALPPVYWAVQRKDLVALKLLEASGASIHWTRADGNSLAFDAASNRDDATLAYLRSKGVSQRGVSDGRMASGFIDAVGNAIANPPPHGSRSHDSDRCYSCGAYKGSYSTGHGLCQSCLSATLYHQ